MGNDFATVSTVVETEGEPKGVAVDRRTGDRYFVDGNQIRLLSTSGVVKTVAGTVAGCKDGPAEQAELNDPRGIALDPRNGDLYFADCGNSRIRVLSAGLVKTLAGQASQGFAEGPADLARISGPTGVALDPRNGDLYFADCLNNRIRVLSGGVVKTVAGTGDVGFKDGPAEQAQLCRPSRIVLDTRNGDIYFNDRENNRLRVLSGGVVSTVAGTGVKGSKDGPADEAELNDPSGITLDPRNGDIYFTDWGSHRLRVLSGGVVSTVAGTGEKGFMDGPADRAQFNGATGITLDPDAATLYVCDLYNKRLRSVALSGPLHLSVSSCASHLAVSPRSLLCRNSRGLTPVEMARLCGESAEVVKFLEERTDVAKITNELNPGVGDEKFNFWYHFWDEL